MAKRYAVLAAALAAVLCLCACASPFQKDYSYAEPYQDEITGNAGTETEIRNLSMLKAAIISLISSGEEKGEFRLSSYNGSVLDDLAAACYEIKTANPIGAYAVESLTFDTSRIVSYYVAEIQVSYKRTAEEIRSIISLSSVSELGECLLSAVEEGRDHLVLKLYSPTVDEAYITGLIQERYLEDPLFTAVEPQVSVTCYPNEGSNRIYDISLDYGAGRSELRRMAQTLEERVESVCLSLRETETARLALETAAWLSGSTAGPGEGNWPGTAYGALVEGQADSRGLAMAYKALCSRLGIECSVVTGFLGGIGLEEHCWNIICVDGDYYHVDVSHFAASPERAFLMSDDQLRGLYMWDAEVYPACSGSLSYWDFVERSPAGEENDGEDSPDGETEGETGEPVPVEPTPPPEEEKIENIP